MHDELIRASALTPADLYKSLYQAYLGPGHAVSSLQAAREGIAEERARLEPVTDADRPMEPLPGPHGLVRVHLRSWPEGRDDDLARALVRTAARFEKDLPGFVRALEAVRCDRLDLPFDDAAWQAYVDARRAEGFPAVRHSAAYRARHHPAYRVIDPVLLHPQA